MASAAYSPAMGDRRRMPREAVYAGESGAVIQMIPRLTEARQKAGLTSVPDKADPEVTSEELAILTLMADGLTLDSVAIRVSMSQRTLSRRLRCVCNRLGVAHPIQAIVWAAHRRLI